jgi:hypothetical protein
MDREYFIFHKGKIHSLINSTINVQLSFLDNRSSISRNLKVAYDALEKAEAAIDVELKKTAADTQSKQCQCTNSCVSTIYVCKDCHGRVNSKR